MSEKYELVRDVIRERQTVKVLADVDQPLRTPESVLERGNAVVLESIRESGWAPFHYPRNLDGIVEPWRAHVLWQSQSQTVARWLRDELQDDSKLPQLLAGCSAVVLVTWLPEDAASSPVPEKVTHRNHEHLAAAASMTQNLLLLLTAAGFGTYWSSGGNLTKLPAKTKVGMNEDESLLGAIFVDYGSGEGIIGKKPGAHRDKRSSEWIREVTQDSL
ncbi:MAG: nitroreductase [Planctomycetota bacterium]